MDVATLGFDVDSSPIKSAVSELGRLSNAARVAERALEKMSEKRTAAKVAYDAAKGYQSQSAAALAAAKASDIATAEDIKAASAAHAKAKAFTAAAKATYDSVNASYSAAKAFAATTQAAQKAAGSGLAGNMAHTDIARMAAAMGDVEKTSNAAARAFATTALAAQRAGAAGAAGAKVVGESSRMAMQQTRNLMFQFQDIGTMLAMGQSPFMLLAQQLPQITMYGGQLTGVMGALKATFASLISPLGLATTAFVLLGSYAVSYFSEWFSSGSEANKIIDEQQQLIAKVAERWGEAYPAIKNYNDEIVRAREQAELMAAVDIVKTDKMAVATQRVQDMRVEFGNLERMLQEANEEPQVIMALRDSMENAFKQMLDLKSATGDFKSAIGILSNDIENTANPAIGSMIDMMKRLSSETQSTANEVAKIINSAAEVQSSLQNIVQLNSFRDKDGVIKQTSGFIPGNPPTPSSRPLIELEGQPWLDKKTGRTKTSAYDNATSSIQDQTRALIAQTAAQATLNPLVNDYGYATSRAKVATDLLLAAEKDKKAITPELTAQINAQADSYARAVVEQNKQTEATKRANDAMNFVKNTTAGFINDLRNGLREGESFWKSFGNAALGVLDRITDRLLNQVLDAVFQVGNATGGGGGFLSGLFGGLFGGGRSAASYAGLTGGLFANGGAFENGIHGYSNQIVNTPTVFAFAKGTGLMGEAGPEAIMPLSKDSSGRLGVSVNGGAAANSNAQPVSISMPISIDATGADAAGLARVERQLAKLQQTLPTTIVSTVRRAQQGRVL